VTPLLIPQEHMRLATPLHRKETVDPRVGVLDWRQQVDIQVPSTFIARSQPKPVSIRLWWREAREVILEFQQSIRIAPPRPQELEYLVHRWLRHYDYEFLLEEPPTQVFIEEYKVEKYVFQQWAYAIGNTFFTIDDLQ